MTGTRLQPSTIKNKVKREELAGKARKESRRVKLQKRLARAKDEAKDPLAKKKRLEANMPRSLDNMREYDPSFLTAGPSVSQEPPFEAGTSQLPLDSDQLPADESALDIENDPFSSYFNSAFTSDPTIPPKVIITTSAKASKPTYSFCDELANVIPGAEFIRRTKGKGFEMGRIATWAAGRGYTNMLVVNEDMKKPNAITMIHLPDGPSVYFKLSSIQFSKAIAGHARSTDHFPELVLNNFATRLGHTVGRMFQTLFPPMPEFQGRQVVTLHNQRDFLFFRRHRYAFRSTEKAALQEIGPRFTLKLRWVKKGLPAVQCLGQPAQALKLSRDEDDAEGDSVEEARSRNNIETNEKGAVSSNPTPPAHDEYIWLWKPELETTRRTFFL